MNKEQFMLLINRYDAYKANKALNWFRFYNDTTERLNIKKKSLSESELCISHEKHWINNPNF